jgi:hypothetical protein
LRPFKTLVESYKYHIKAKLLVDLMAEPARTVQRTVLSLKEHILTSTESVVQEAGDVKIDIQKLSELAQQYAKPGQPLELPRWNLPVFLNKDDEIVPGQKVTQEQISDFMLLGNTINFCYTNIESKKKYYTMYGIGKDGKEAMWTGAMGMWASLKRAVLEGIPILNGEYLANLTVEQAAAIFNRPPKIPLSEKDAQKFTHEIPLLEERVTILREIGEVLMAKYEGHFHKLVEAANGRLFDNGNGVVDRLLRDFPSFRDVSEYNKRPVVIDKRAQLAAAMLHEKLLDIGAPTFPESDTRQLTVFVNYELPKVLRALGIIQYSKKLAARVDNQEEIPYGTPEEVEIRSVTLYAANRLEEEIRAINPASGVTALHVDFKLWNSGRKLDPEIYKHHLTRTTAY